jgi:hypothetical protein
LVYADVDDVDPAVEILVKVVPRTAVKTIASRAAIERIVPSLLQDYIIAIISAVDVIAGTSDDRLPDCSRAVSNWRQNIW